jgi:cysteine desulfurase
MIYLDNSATTQVSKEVASFVHKAMTEDYGNPSALHSMGQDAERAIKHARYQLALIMGARPAQIIFTGSGTESNTLAFASVFHNPLKTVGRTMMISAVEHPAVRETAAHYASLGASCVSIPVNSEGVADTDFIRGELSTRTAVISVMHVNNEIGTIQPIDEICKIKAGFAMTTAVDVTLHVDAVQSFAKLPISVDADFSRVDMISMSGHKLHGPKGVGALYAVKPAKLHPLIRGGGQEFGIRSGTENVPAIVGFGHAVGMEAEPLAHAECAAACRKRLMEGLMSALGDGCIINGPREASVTGEAGYCSPYILSVSFPGTRGEVLVHELERHGIFVSTGAACSAGKRNAGKPSHVLSAIGRTAAEAQGTLRFSFSRYNTPEEIDCVLEHLVSAVKTFRWKGFQR